jgi:hypothetical protein
LVGVRRNEDVMLELDEATEIYFEALRAAAGRALIACVDVVEMRGV